MAKRSPPKHSQFKPGQSGNPGGRPKNREVLANAYTNDVLTVWIEMGIVGLRKLAEKDPERFAAIAAAEIPKDAQKAVIEHSGTVQHRAVSEVDARIAELLGPGRDKPETLPH